MGSDLSRVRHNPLLDLAGVELQQGRVALDGDFNELVAVVDRRLRALASDVLGRSTVSQTTPDAFKITVPGGALQIGRGRLYVDGLLAENHGAATTDPAKKRFDALMAEPAFVDSIAYAAQPYLPAPPPLPGAGKHLVYLDVWQREVTHLERPDLVETAIGVDTSSRLQTVWQVRVLGEEAGTAVCGSADGDIAGWAGLIAPSSGRLTTGTFEAPLSTDPCELPPSGGYRGLENQTYRVEIHDPGQPGTATFKWSRDNASVASRVTSMVSGTELELQTLGRDDVLRFSSGDWVEILDDAREFSQRCGELRRITVNEAARRITFAPALPADMLSPAFPDSDGPRDRNLRVRRWDHKGQVLAATGSGATSVVQDLNAPGSTGAIGVPAAGTTLLLENGVTVRFSSAGAKGFRAGDFWIFVARTADASVEPLDEAPPRGVHHHYARLGIWDVAAGDVTDCRTPWPPRGEGDDCSCTECVTPESHASGALTVQAAVDRIRLTGGTVCLGVGQYQLRQPVRIAGARSVRIKGQGTATVVVAQEGAFTMRNVVAVAIEDLTVVSLGGGPAIGVRTALGLSLQRLLLAVLGAKDASASAIALAGAVIGATIRENAILSPVGVQVLDASEDAKAPPVLLSAVLRIEDNVLWCERQGVALEGRVMHTMSTRIIGNELLGCRLGGIAALGLCGTGASMRIDDNSLNVSGPGISAAVDGLWIEENKLTASPQSGNRQPDGAGISVRTGLDPTGVDQCHIRSNQIAGFPEAGIAIRAPIRSLIVALNTIERCGDGVVSQEDARAASVSIEHNHIADVGAAGNATPRSVVAIGLLRAGAATVAGNIIRRVGLGATQAALHAGISAVSVERLRASGNDITGVAPVGEFLGIGAGVIVGAPYVQAEITLNHVDRDEVPSAQASKSTWFAVLVGQPNDARTVARAGAFTTVSLDDGRTLVVGAKRPFLVAAPAAFNQAGAAPAAFNQAGTAPATLNQAVAAPAALNQAGTAPATLNQAVVAPAALNQAGTAPATLNQAVVAPAALNQAVVATAALNQAAAVAARGSSLSVLGNVLAARGSSPAVQLTATEDCLFSDNRCELRGSGGVPIVRILSAATVVNANRARGTGDGASIHLQGNAKSITVVGNITTGPIIVGSPNSAPLSAPWDVLNIRS